MLLLPGGVDSGGGGGGGGGGDSLLIDTPGVRVFRPYGILARYTSGPSNSVAGTLAIASGGHTRHSRFRFRHSRGGHNRSNHFRVYFRMDHGLVP
jgi:hypothetical protein